MTGGRVIAMPGGGHFVHPRVGSEPGTYYPPTLGRIVPYDPRTECITRVREGEHCQCGAFEFEGVFVPAKVRAFWWPWSEIEGW